MIDTAKVRASVGIGPCGNETALALCDEIDRLRNGTCPDDPPHRRGRYAWSYCPCCGVKAPRPGLHREGCPASKEHL